MSEQAAEARGRKPGRARGCKTATLLVALALLVGLAGRAARALLPDLEPSYVFPMHQEPARPAVGGQQAGMEPASRGKLVGADGRPVQARRRSPTPERAAHGPASVGKSEQSQVNEWPFFKSIQTARQNQLAAAPRQRLLLPDELERRAEPSRPQAGASSTTASTSTSTSTTTSTTTTTTTTARPQVEEPAGTEPELEPEEPPTTTGAPSTTSPQPETTTTSTESSAVERNLLGADLHGSIQAAVDRIVQASRAKPGEGAGRATSGGSSLSLNVLLKNFGVQQLAQLDQILLKSTLRNESHTSERRLQVGGPTRVEAPDAECKIEYSARHVNISLLNGAGGDYTCDYIIDRKLTAKPEEAAAACGLQLASKFFAADEQPDCAGRTYLAVGGRRFCQQVGGPALSRTFDFPAERDAFELKVVHRQPTAGAREPEIHLDIRPLTGADCALPVTPPARPVQVNQRAQAAETSQPAQVSRPETSRSEVSRPEMSRPEVSRLEVIQPAQVSQAAPVSQAPSTSQPTTPVARPAQVTPAPQASQPPQSARMAQVASMASMASMAQVAQVAQVTQAAQVAQVTQAAQVAQQPQQPQQLQQPQQPQQPRLQAQKMQQEPTRSLAATSSAPPRPAAPRSSPRAVAGGQVSRTSQSFELDGRLESCDGLEHSAVAGQLASPGYPASRASNLSCRLTVRRASVAHCRLLLHFRDFELAGPSEPDCPSAYLEVGETRYCNRYAMIGHRMELEFPRAPAEPQLELRLVSRSTQPARGFLIKYQQLPCGSQPAGPPPAELVGRTLAPPRAQPDFGLALKTARPPAGLQEQVQVAATSLEALAATAAPSAAPSCDEQHSEMSFLLRSPQAPGHYPNGAACQYRLLRNSSRVCYLELTFLAFDLEADASCRFDYLEINGVRLCGSLRDLAPQHTTRIYLFEEAAKLVRFRSDASTTRAGFLVRADQLECAPDGAILRRPKTLERSANSTSTIEYDSPQPPTCDRELAGRELVLASPSRPAGLCKLSVLRQPGACQLELRFLELRLAAADCLELAGRELLCGPQARPPVRYLAFEGRARLTLTLIAGDSKEEEEAPRFLAAARQLDCQTEATSRPAPRYANRTAGRHAQPDALLAYDLGAPPASNRSRAQLSYAPSGARGCPDGAALLLPDQLMSARYPAGYPSWAQCRLQLERSSERACQVELEFLDLELAAEGGTGCGQDFVQVAGGERLCRLEQLPGARHKLLAPLDAAGRLEVAFQSGGGGGRRRRGFLALHRQLDCAGRPLVEPAPLGRLQLGAAAQPAAAADCSLQLNQLSGALSSAGLLARTAGGPAPAECRLTVRLLAGFCSLRLSFPDFELAARRLGDCPLEALEVEGVRHCGTELRGANLTLAPALAGQRHLSLRYLPTTDSRGFRAVFRQLECKPEPLRALGGGARPAPATPLPAQVDFREIRVQEEFFELSSAKLGGSGADYAPNMFVVYRVRRARPDVCRIRLLFYQFQLEPSPGCRRDFLDVNNVDRLCGRLAKPEDFQRDYDWTDERDFLVSFVSDAAHQAPGYLLLGQQLSANCSAGAAASQPATGAAFDEESPRRAELGAGSEQLPPARPALADASHSRPEAPGSLPKVHEAPSSLPKFHETPGSLPSDHEAPSSLQADPRAPQSDLEAPDGRSAAADEPNLQPDTPKSSPTAVGARQSPQSSSGSCNQLHREAKFELSSPNWPHRYEPNLTCLHLVERAAGACSLSLRVASLVLGAEEEPANCAQLDHLDVDGQLLCGLGRRARTLSVAFAGRPFLAIKFSSRAATPTGFGFLLEAEQVPCPASSCNRLLLEEESLIEVEEQQQRDECLLVSRRRNQSVCALELELHQFQLDADCQLDYLELDGTRLCGSSYPAHHRLRFGFGPGERDKLLRFHSESGAARLSLTARQLVGCEPELAGANSSELGGAEFGTLCQFEYQRERQLLLSPGYHESKRRYPSNLHCLYKVVAKSYAFCSLKLTFLDLDLEPSADCQRDYLLVDQQRYCANATAPVGPLEVPFGEGLPREVHLLLHTDAHLSRGRGFKLLYEQVACAPDQNFGQPDERQTRRLRFGQLSYPRDHVSEPAGRPEPADLSLRAEIEVARAGPPT